MATRQIRKPQKIEYAATQKIFKLLGFSEDLSEMRSTDIVYWSPIYV